MSAEVVLCTHKTTSLPVWIILSQVHHRISTNSQPFLVGIVSKVLRFTGKESECNHWSEMFIALTRARSFTGILLGTEQAPNADEAIDRKKNEGGYEPTEAERK